MGGSMGSQMTETNDNQEIHSGAGGHDMRHNGMGPMIPGNHGGMANSYEFYGEDQPDDSESVEEEMMHVSNKRGGRMA